jgi:hypothetical protein
MTQNIRNWIGTLGFPGNTIVSIRIPRGQVNNDLGFYGFVRFRTPLQAMSFLAFEGIPVNFNPLTRLRVNPKANNSGG